jgi:hypothetical protein
VDIGLFNQISEHGGGLQLGIDNSFISSYLSWTPDQSFSGIRLGVCNGGSNFKGFQFGLVNYYNPNVVEDERGGNFSGIAILEVLIFHCEQPVSNLGRVILHTA